jgi:hypothetical protein
MTYVAPNQDPGKGGNVDRRHEYPKCPKCNSREVVVYEYGPGGVERKFICWDCGTKFRPAAKGVAISWAPPGEFEERMVFPLQIGEASA